MFHLINVASANGVRNDNFCGIHKSAIELENSINLWKFDWSKRVNVRNQQSTINASFRKVTEHYNSIILTPSQIAPTSLIEYEN